MVSTGSARARGRIADLDRDAIRLSFDTKVIGPLMLAKHLAPRVNEGGSFVIFSGVAATKITVGTLGVAITNAAADTLARSLALELAPIRVNSISPGLVGDSPKWDAIVKAGENPVVKAMVARTPTRRFPTMADVIHAVFFLLDNQSVNGHDLDINGGYFLM